jgi:mycofactocin precursor
MTASYSSSYPTDCVDTMSSTSEEQALAIGDEEDIEVSADEEFEELIIEDFTIDGICGVY